MLKDQPALDKDVEYLLDWYFEIRGDTTLTFTEINSWASLMNIKLLPYEVQIIIKLDRLYWEHKTNG
jgi:hypothetical protein